MLKKHGVDIALLRDSIECLRLDGERRIENNKGVKIPVEKIRASAVEYVDEIEKLKQQVSSGFNLLEKISQHSKDEDKIQAADKILTDATTCLKASEETIEKYIKCRGDILDAVKLKDSEIIHEVRRIARLCTNNLAMAFELFNGDAVFSCFKGDKVATKVVQDAVARLIEYLLAIESFIELKAVLDIEAARSIAAQSTSARAAG